MQGIRTLRRILCSGSVSIGCEYAMGGLPKSSSLVVASLLQLELHHTLGFKPVTGKSAAPWAQPQQLISLQDFDTRIKPSNSQPIRKLQRSLYDIHVYTSCAFSSTTTSTPRTATEGKPSTATPRLGGNAPKEKPSDFGWTSREVLNAPNLISVARLLSGPVIAYWILHEAWGPALVGTAVSGWSDWLDGYVARRWNQGSVLGSYLDPLADKALVCCVVGALGYQGTMPAPLVAVFLGRDVVLVAGAFVHRAKVLKWKWPGFAKFFRLPTDLSSPGQPQAGPGLKPPLAPAPTGAGASPSGSGAASHIPPAPSVEPLFVSKVNTVLQLAYVTGCMSSAWCGWPPEPALMVLGWTAGTTTVVSGAMYVRAYLAGQLLQTK